MFRALLVAASASAALCQLTLVAEVASSSSFRLGVRFDGWSPAALPTTGLSPTDAAPSTPVSWGGMSGVQTSFGALLVSSATGAWALYDAANRTLVSGGAPPSQNSGAGGVDAGVVLPVAGASAAAGPSRNDNCLGNGDFGPPFFFNRDAGYLAFAVSSWLCVRPPPPARRHKLRGPHRRHRRAHLAASPPARQNSLRGPRRRHRRARPLPLAVTTQITHTATPSTLRATWATPRSLASPAATLASRSAPAWTRPTPCARTSSPTACKTQRPRRHAAALATATRAARRGFGVTAVIQTLREIAGLSPATLALRHAAAAPSAAAARRRRSRRGGRWAAPRTGTYPRPQRRSTSTVRFISSRERPRSRLVMLLDFWQPTGAIKPWKKSKAT